MEAIQPAGDSRRVRICSLIYHDVVPAGSYGASGFQSPDANIYKLTVDEFERHLNAISPFTAVPVFDALSGRTRGREAFTITFDDGGVSAIRDVALLLEKRGWAGHFFVATDYIGTPGFLTAAQIVELAARGHIVGSHSCSHPLVMSRCSREQLLSEWSRSVAILSDILGSRVTVASIPGGSYSRAVAETAARSGIRVLFTSEPTVRLHTVGSCTVLGRYSVQAATPPDKAASLVAGDWRIRTGEAAYWNFKKILKAAGGPAWLKFRRAVLASRYRGQ